MALEGKTEDEDDADMADTADTGKIARRERLARLVGAASRIADAYPSLDGEKHIVRRGRQWCVVTQDYSHTLGCHGTRADALNHLRAIEANKVDAKQRPKPKPGELVCPGCGSIVKPDSEGNCPECGTRLPARTPEPTPAMDTARRRQRQRDQTVACPHCQKDFALDEKIGRVISAANMTKLKDAHNKIGDGHKGIADVITSAAIPAARTALQAADTTPPERRTFFTDDDVAALTGTLDDLGKKAATDLEALVDNLVRDWSTTKTSATT
jgi:uncharacterized protein with PIN domain